MQRKGALPPVAARPVGSRSPCPAPRRFALCRSRLATWHKTPSIYLRPDALDRPSLLSRAGGGGQGGGINHDDDSASTGSAPRVCANRWEQKRPIAALRARLHAPVPATRPAKRRAL